MDKSNHSFLLSQAIDIPTLNRLWCVLNIEPDVAMQAYCVKCRAKKEMRNPQQITMKNDKPATKGICPSRGTKMFRIGG